MKVQKPQIPQDTITSFNIVDTITDLLESGYDIEKYHFKNSVFFAQAPTMLFFDKCIFEKCTFSKCNNNYVFSNIVFKDCDLTNMDFSDAGFSSVEFTNCNMTGINMTRAKLSDVSINK